MHFADLLLLSLAALWQQKLRTLLTTLGVAFGALVLFVSISLGIGVQETIGREARKYDELRRISVYAKNEPTGESMPSEVTAFPGDLSTVRRQRLQEAARSRWESARAYKRQRITLPKLLELASLDHVERVVPNLYLDGWIHHGERADRGGIVAVHPAEQWYRRKLLSGAVHDDPNGRMVLVSELRVYHWGFHDDADLQRVIGQKVRLEFRSRKRGRREVNVGLPPMPDTEVTREHELLRSRIQEQLPEALAKLELSPPERAMLDELLKPRSGDEQGKEVVLNEEFTIGGVFRMPNAEDASKPWEGLNYFADIILPVGTAQQFYLQLAVHDKEPGFEGLTILVDREENVKAVFEHVKAKGYNAHAFLEHIQREQFLYKLIFAGMTCVAGVALLVACLGITNTMLMSVLERTREVGIMKAVGAAERQIQLIFLIEGALIGLVGGGLGVLLSWVCSIPGDRWIRSMVETEMKLKLEESLFTFPVWLLGGVVVFCVLVTVLAAVYPARRASRVNAVAALRHE
jgi:putative ABC transport system permease protein